MQAESERNLIFSQASLNKADINVRFHSHPGTELILTVSGYGEITVGKETYECSPGKLLIVPPETMHNHLSRDRLIVSFIVFTCSPSFFDSRQRQLSVSSEPWCERLFQTVCGLSEETRYELCEGVLSSLLTCIRRLEEKMAGCDDIHPALQKALLYLRENFSHAISMDELAHHVGVSGIYLRKLFGAQLHISPAKYLLNLRMAHARELLRNSYMSIAEVGYKSGFPDNNYFTRQFHKVHRCTPREYRDVIQKRPDGSFIRM